MPSCAALRLIDPVRFSQNIRAQRRVGRELGRGERQNSALITMLDHGVSHIALAVLSKSPGILIAREPK